MSSDIFWLVATCLMLLYFWVKGPEPPPKVVPAQPPPTKLEVLTDHYDKGHIDVETFEARVGILMRKKIADAPAELLDRAWWIPLEGEDDDD